MSGKREAGSGKRGTTRPEGAITSPKHPEGVVTSPKHPEGAIASPKHPEGVITSAARDLLFRAVAAKQILRTLRALVITVSFGVAANAQSPLPASPFPLPASTYYAFIGSEGNDEVSLVRFGPKGASVDHKFRMGTNPTELIGPHGVGVSPDGKYYYVSTAHGMPNGALWKYTTVGDSLKGRVTLGSFPATVQVSPNGAYIYVVNFNLHGDMVPSSVSIVYGDGMLEIARVPTCVMPHGSRFNPQGTKHYSACMMNDALVEIDANTFKVSRHFMLTKGSEHGMSGPVGSMASASHDMSGHGSAAPKPGDISCSPTWAQPSADGAKIFVACNKSSEIVEIDANTWTMTRRIPTGDGVYNLAVSHNGKLLIGTNKRGHSVSVIDIASGKELARIPTSRKLASGVAVSSDD
ncbi:MAG TPA: YncE family protein, partial [Gemmatimonadaceae bacterium]